MNVAMKSSCENGFHNGQVKTKHVYSTDKQLADKKSIFYELIHVHSQFS